MKNRLGWRTAAIVGSFYLLLAAVTLQPLTNRRDALPDNADALHSAWVVSWVARQTVTDPLSLFQANVAYPDPASLALSEPNLAIGWLALPIFLATGDAIATYNLTLVATIALCGFTMFLLARELTGLHWRIGSRRPDLHVHDGQLRLCGSHPDRLQPMDAAHALLPRPLHAPCEIP